MDCTWIVASSQLLLSRLAENRMVSPPGNNCGRRWVTSPFCLSSWVAGCGAPPEDDTRKTGVCWPSKRILPSSPQEAPRGLSASQRVTAAPPSTEIFFSFPPAKNPIQRLSGEKNGAAAPSVPPIVLDFELASNRTERCVPPLDSEEAKASR